MDSLALPLTVTTALAPVRKGDFRTNTAFGVEMLFPVTEKDEFTAGYDFSQSFYSDFTNLNLQGHTISGRYTHEAAEDLNLSANANFTYYNLDGDDFLHLFNIGPSAFFHEKGPFFGRVGYNFANFNYKQNSGQDSNIHTISLTQYYFLPDSEDFISVGYLHSEADASLKRWDYDMNMVFVSGKHQFDPKRYITGSFSYSLYDYHGFDTLQTSKKREDNILSFVARYTYEVSEWADIFVRYSYLDNGSNLTRQAYTSNMVSIGTTLTW